MPTQPLHVVITSPGSKVALVQRLRDAVHGRGGTLSGWEADPYSPAATRCDRRVDGGAIDNADAARHFLEWCTRERVHLVIPSRHDDLPTLAAVSDLFAAAGITVAVSAPETIALCVDKTASHAWLNDAGIPVPDQATIKTLSTSQLAGKFPMIAKHPRGSGSRGIRMVHSPADLEGLPGDWIVQGHAPGVEFTVNTYAARDGRCLCEIPHERILTSEGEVVRGCTSRIPTLMSLARRITESLPGARGPLNIQIFWDVEQGRATAIEINPRFGGGYPLAHEAGGRFTEWLIAEYIDGATLPRVEAWEDRLMMVRYRESVFFQAVRS